jgi:hypothetical protein
VRFENKNIFFYFEKCHSFLEEKTFETGWGVGANQLLETACFFSHYTIRLLGI